MTDVNELIDLYTKSVDYQFTPDEIEKIKKASPKHEYEVRYCIYKPKSNKDMYITLVFDTKCTSTRRSGVANQWEEICRRKVTTKEWMEFIENFGTNNRRFKVFTYKYIDILIKDDKAFGVDTPKEFIDVCKERGYVEQNAQLNLFK